MAASGKCPICSRWYSGKFLELHAANCSDAQPAILSQVSSTTGISERRFSQNFLSLAQVSESKPTAGRVPGFFIFEDFVPSECESRLLERIENTPPKWKDLRVRQSKNYGPPFSFEHRRLMFERDGFKQTPLPEYAEEIVLPLVRDKVPQMIYAGVHPPNQLLIAKYDGRKETHIMPHSDCENDDILDPILGLSLSAGTTMTLVLPRTRSGTGKIIKHDVYLPRRSLYIMSGPALYVWHHGIFPGKTEGVRYSLTFRRASPGWRELRAYPRKSPELRPTTLKSTKRFRQTLLRQ